MAEVLMPSSNTITIPYTRPSSADAFQDSAPQTPRLGQTPRSMYSQPASMYRGSSTTPVQPYAFQSTPQLRSDARSIPTNTTSQAPPSPSFARHAASASQSSASSANSSTKDAALASAKAHSIINLSTAIPDLSLINLDQPIAKASPDRYRRPQQKHTDSTSTLEINQQHPQPKQPIVDDMAVRGATESAKRYRRRSQNGLDSTNLSAQDGASSTISQQQPSSSDAGMHGAMATPATGSGSKDTAAPKPSLRDQQFTSNDTIKPVNAIVGRHDPRNAAVPPRSSSDASKKLLTTPSPLSQQMAESPSSPEKPRTYAAVASANLRAPSPAAQQLAAVSDRDLNKGMKSRLRRAFSFGSAQELRRASAQNNAVISGARGDDDNDEEDMDEEQREIARRQEAAGIGAGIYSGQGGFTGSRDNMSISSTASSASLMLRKMGQGARKGARSVRGLFRPKSVIGVPAADGPVQPRPSQIIQPSVAQVSMINVEAERQKVNVNVDPHDVAGGGTGFPKLEHNSLDAAAASRASADDDSATSRRSVVGSDKDRADVLAAVKKGILKRSGTSSPVLRAAEGITLPTASPALSKPGTPNKDRAHVHASNDYFSARLATLTVTKSMPDTPNGTNRNISFSPRLQFHDAFSSTEYDRRGEIATCNRLTPMLAQQIKEELNTFKMEMEVHEQSKPHTHFF